MTIRTQQVTVPVAGSAGSATGSAQTGVISGRIIGIHLDYTSQPAIADVTIATSHAPGRTLLTATNANSDAWFYPRVAMQDTAGAAITFDGTHGLYEPIPVNDHVTVSVAQGDPGSVVATILYEC